MVLKKDNLGKFEKKFNISEFDLRDLSKTKTGREIANVYNCSDSHISSLLKLYNIKGIRNRSYNKYFFEELDNQNVHYILGLFVTDGCLSYDKKSYNKSVLFYGAKENICFIKDKLKSEHKISKHMTDNCYKLFIGSKYMFKSLENLQQTPRKTGYECVPDIYFNDYFYMFRHFVRGVIDGDGTVDLSAGCDIRIVSSSYRFLEQLRFLLKKDGIKVGKKFLQKRGEDLWYLRFSGANEIVRKYLYEDVEGFLSYKRDRVMNRVNSKR